MTIRWTADPDSVDWAEAAALFRAAPLGNKTPGDLEFVFRNSMFCRFAFDAGRLVAVGRALADGRDCACICDIAVLPSYQGRGLGKQVVVDLVNLARHHRKLILYTVPGKEGFYEKLGFRRMMTAMAIFENQADAAARGLIAGP